MNSLPYMSLIITVCAAVFYYRAALFENESPLLWTALSVLTSILALLVLGFGWLGCILCQLALLAAITLYRALRSARNRK